MRHISFYFRKNKLKCSIVYRTLQIYLTISFDNDTNDSKCVFTLPKIKQIPDINAIIQSSDEASSKCNCATVRKRDSDEGEVYYKLKKEMNEDYLRFVEIKVWHMYIIRKCNLHDLQKKHVPYVLEYLVKSWTFCILNLSELLICLLCFNLLL